MSQKSLLRREKNGVSVSSDWASVWCSFLITQFFALFTVGVNDSRVFLALPSQILVSSEVRGPGMTGARSLLELP